MNYRLFSPRRYSMCRKIFAQPWEAHKTLTFDDRQARNDHAPFTLEFPENETLTFTNNRATRDFFDALFRRGPVIMPVIQESKQLVFDWKGTKLGVRPQSDVLNFREVFLDDDYRLSRIRSPLKNVLDIGGNVGLFSLRASEVADRITTFEPVSAQREVMERNLKRAGVLEKVEICPNAVSGNDGEKLRIYLSEHSTCASISEASVEYNGEVQGYEDVETISLAGIFERYELERCDFLKCDIEGAEYPLFEAAPKETLEKVDRIAMEVHFSGPEFTLERFNAMKDKFSEAGLKIENQDPMNSEGKLKKIILLYAHRNGWE